MSASAALRHLRTGVFQSLSDVLVPAGCRRGTNGPPSSARPGANRRVRVVVQDEGPSDLDAEPRLCIVLAPGLYLPSKSSINSTSSPRPKQRRGPRSRRRPSCLWPRPAERFSEFAVVTPAGTALIRLRKITFKDERDGVLLVDRCHRTTPAVREGRLVVAGRDEYYGFRDLVGAVVGPHGSRVAQGSV